MWLQILNVTLTLFLILTLKLTLFANSTHKSEDLNLVVLGFYTPACQMYCT